MSQAAPPSDQAGKKAKSPLAPPDERFWHRYSPHAEFPLSGAGSLVVHVLVFGILALMAWLGAMLFDQSNRKLPVEAVRLAAGGGGSPKGVGDNPNTGPAPQEVGAQSKEETQQDLPTPDVPNPKDIKVEPSPNLKTQFDNPAVRQIQKPDASSAIAKLRSQLPRLQEPGSDVGSRSHGQGGPGSGGGDGRGIGPGKGDASGPGKTANLTEREKRLSRWIMRTPPGINPEQTLTMLHKLGAILAIPVARQGDNFEYKIVRDLMARPAKLLDEDINDVLRETGSGYIWDYPYPGTVEGVLSLLRVPVPKIDRAKLHLLAFMPVKLEDKLARLELDYFKKHHRNRREDDIAKTIFDLKLRNGQYEPEVKSQDLR